MGKNFFIKVAHEDDLVAVVLLLLLLLDLLVQVPNEGSTRFVACIGVVVGGGFFSQLANLLIDNGVDACSVCLAGLGMPILL